MTDNEIIKALECCRCDDEDLSNCEDCPLDCNNLFVCHTKLSNYALSLIDRQKAEIDRLEIELKAMRGAANSYKAEVERLHSYDCYRHCRAEAIKEFLEKASSFIKMSSLIELEYGKDVALFANVIKVSDLVRIYKEMKGESEDGKGKE